MQDLNYESEDLIRAIELVDKGYSYDDIYVLAHKLFLIRKKEVVKINLK